MNAPRRNIGILWLIVMAFCAIGLTALRLEAQPVKAVGKLDYVYSVSRPDLATVNWLELSADGKFLYAAAWRLGSLNVFRRDPASGKLEHRQNITDEALLGGSTGLAISPNGSYAMAAAFRSQNVVLFERDGKDGMLEKLDFKHNNADEVQGLDFPVHAVFSPDSKFAYVANAGGAQPGSITAFGITKDGKLKFVEANFGSERCFQEARGVAMHPKGNFVAVVSSSAGTLVLLERNTTTGKTKVVQVLRGLEEEGKGTLLTGGMQAAFSADGSFLYTSAGRFMGRSAVRAYRLDPSGKLALINELPGGSDHLENFTGGNGLTVSSDGLSVYAVATQSGALACFRRDPNSGRIDAVETLSPEDQSLAGAAGVAISPDGRFVYAAAENHQSIAVFQRQVQ
jgi:6-phosphogluconolactonase (cycloisomerase 2 family)